ncbi:MAG: hypothetical protein CMJ95_03470 [Planctomycetes bacterium]|nr:hypothetical protein [Planctomycetota bacterium]
MWILSGSRSAGKHLTDGEGTEKDGNPQGGKYDKGYRTIVAWKWKELDHLKNLPWELGEDGCHYLNEMGVLIQSTSRGFTDKKRLRS